MSQSAEQGLDRPVGQALEGKKNTSVGEVTGSAEEISQTSHRRFDATCMVRSSLNPLDVGPIHSMYMWSKTMYWIDNCRVRK